MSDPNAQVCESSDVQPEYYAIRLKSSRITRDPSGLQVPITGSARVLAQLGLP